MFKNMKKFLTEELKAIDEAGLYKRERIIITPQTADIKISTGQEVINFCANNYLGLSDHPRLIKAAKEAMDARGFGMSSVRFICGTQDIHKELEQAIARYFHIIVTDGVFSMDGNVAPMDKICDLAEKYDALVMVDECHSAGVVGRTGRGVAEQFDCYGRIDLHTGTLGKAFGGAIGGFTTGPKEIIDMLRQRSRPYLFSNSIPPAVVGAGLEVFKMLEESDALHTKLMENVEYFRDKMLAAGFDIKPTQSAICAVMLYDAKLSQEYAARLLEEGIYVTGFYYPVVPKGQARIRVQLSAAHERHHLDKAIAAFIKVGRELGALK